MIELYARFAERNYSHRKWFALFALAVVVLSFLLAVLRVPGSLQIDGGVAFPAMTISWCLYLVCVWFHPQQGAFMRPAPTGRFRGAWFTLRRWYAAVFLVLFVVVGTFGFVALTFFGDSVTGLTTRLSGP